MKDRMAKAVIERAEADGRLRRGATRPPQQQPGSTAANRPAANGDPPHLATALQSARQERARALIAANGANGKSTAGAPAATMAAPRTELAPLKGAVSDLLVHLDETVDLLRSMREKPLTPPTHNTRDQRSTTASGRTT